MSSEETDVELPVAAYEWRYVDWEEAHTVLRHDEPDRSSFDVELELVDELVTKPDAEEAIQEARQQERQEIIDKIKEKENEWAHPKDCFIDERARALRTLLEELEEEVDQS